MEKRTTKTKKGILVAVMVALLIALIAGTYARYTSTGTANVNAEIAKWHVELEGEDISTQSATIDADFEYDANSFVKDGKLAPGRSGHFTVEVDPTGSEVAIDYTFAIDESQLNSQSAIAVTGATYTIGEGLDAVEGTATMDENGVVTVSESLAQVQAGDKVKLTVTVAWDNADDANSEADTAEGVASYDIGQDNTKTAEEKEAGKVLTIPVTVTASQKI